MHRVGLIGCLFNHHQRRDGDGDGARSLVRGQNSTEQDRTGQQNIVVKMGSPVPVDVASGLALVHMAGWLVTKGGGGGERNTKKKMYSIERRE